MTLGNTNRTRLFSVIGLVACITLLAFWEFSFRRTPPATEIWKPEFENAPALPEHGSNTQYIFKPMLDLFIGDLEKLKPANFRLMQLSAVTETASKFCPQRKAECRLHDEIVLHLAHMATLEGDVRLHVIPVDPLAWIHEADPTAATALMKKLVKHLDAERSYIKFKGSDYTFVCLTAACQKFGEEFAPLLAEDKGSRAVIIGVDLDAEQMRWPCPLRVISLDEIVLRNTGYTAERIIRQATFSIQPHNRWVCSDRMRPENYFGTHTESMHGQGVFLKEHGFLMCQLPKSGSTMIMFLLRRMSHKSNWKSTEDGLPHNPFKSGVKYVSNKRDFALTKAVFEDPSVIKAAVVRNPFSRLLSGYLDKIQTRKEYGFIPRLDNYVKKHGHPTFHEFVNFLIKEYPDPSRVDAHFRLQSAGCGFRYHRFDFVCHLDKLAMDFKEFSVSLDFWKPYVSSGWGKDGKSSFGKSSDQDFQCHAAEVIWHYYTEDLLKTVYKYYKEDFDRFGFSLEEALATKPSGNTTLHPPGDCLTPLPAGKGAVNV